MTNALDLPFGQPEEHSPALAEQSWRFHRHLDVCAQCRNNPQALCPTGYLLLSVEVAQIDAKEAA